MPEPGKNEKQDEFIGRCIPILIKEGRKQDQAVAICFSKWKKAKGIKESFKEHFNKNEI